MKYTVKPTAHFQKDLKNIQKRGYDINKISSIVKMLADEIPLPVQYKDHPLKGNFSGCRECHIQPDWLLIYEYSGGDLILYLTRTGTHSDLFGK